MSRVVVMGGSRGIGLETVKALLERGDDVIAFSRGANILQLDHPKLTKQLNFFCLYFFYFLYFLM